MEKKIRFAYENRLYDSITRQFGELPTWEEFGIGKDLVESQKRSYLADAILVTPELLPEIYEAYQSCITMIGHDVKGDLFVRQSPDMNASVYAHEGCFNILVNSILIDKFSIEELKFVFGHELGHVVFGHSRFPLKEIIIRLSDTQLDALKLLLRWSCSCEISADRVGLLCCGNMIKSVSTLFKISSGLTNVDDDKILRALRNQYESLLAHIKEFQITNTWGRTHPMIPIRFKALELAALDIVSLRSNPDLFNWKSFEKVDHHICNVIESIDFSMQ